MASFDRYHTFWITTRHPYYEGFFLAIPIAFFFVIGLVQKIY
jgi:hypothetical protein